MMGLSVGARGSGVSRWNLLSAALETRLSVRAADRAVLGAILLLAFLVSWTPAGATTTSLYQRLGGEPVVGAVVADTIDRVSIDPRLGRSFKDVNLRKLKQHVTTFICSITGGGCQWDGDTMKQAHAGLGINEAEMYGFVQIFSDALDRHGVGLREKNELLALLAPMKHDVVTSP